MDILNLYENASGKLENASKSSFEIETKITSITMILSSKEQLYVGFNSKKINQSLEIEDVSSEYMALAEFLFAQETVIDTIITIDSETLLPQNPSDDFINMILNMNINNKSCKVVTGKNSQVMLSSLNDKIPELITEIETKLKEKSDEVVLKIIDDAEEAKSKEEEKPEVSSMGIDTSGLKMIYDDWESAEVSEEETNNVQENKPFNANSLSSQNHENTKNEQQSVNGMYQQQPMNSMYQQQPMNGMYQQQPMNGMYQQQPMNGMYQQQQPMNNGMYQQNGTNSLYIHQMNNQGANTNQNFGQPATPNTSNYLNGMQAPVTTATSPSGTTQQMSVYGSNISAGDNNAIFKDRLNDILGTSNKSTVEEEPIEDAMQSVKDKKKAAKIDAKFIKKQKKNNNL